MGAYAPVAIAVLRGPEHFIELANPPYRAFFNGRDIVGRTIRKALPELEGQGIFELLDNVYATGERFVGRSFRGLIQRSPAGELEECFFDFV